MSEATICPGIVGFDGIVRGRISDVDLFGEFSLDMTQAKDLETGEYVLSEAERKKIARDPNGGMLWTTRKKKLDKRADEDKMKQQRLAVYAACAQNGLGIFEDLEQDG